MVVERETVVERPVERETVVTSGGGGSAGIVGGIIAAVLVVGVLFWIFGGSITGGDKSVSIEVPDVTVTTPAE
ncbi:MAG: hypothetical protein CL534_02185 [Ahrensia sp.]|nr:hypothetical protein [Ahrensia sp.]